MNVTFRVAPRILCLFALAAISLLTAGAAPIVFVLDNPAQSGGPGANLQYFGTITNTGPDTVFLNGDSIDAGGAPGDFMVNGFFFINVPSSLASMASSGDIELFEITVGDPFPGQFATFDGSYVLFGGADRNAQDSLGTASFTLTTTDTPDLPEPAPWAMLACGLLGLPLLRRHRLRRPILPRARG